MRDQTDSRTLPLPLPLTIDRESLGELWLPAFREKADAVELIRRDFHKAIRAAMVGQRSARGVSRMAQRREDAYGRAYTVMKSELERTVEVIRERGGLLLAVNA